MEGVISTVETVLNLMLLLDVSKTAACELYAGSWGRTKGKVLEVVNSWIGKRELLWSPPRPCGAAAPSYPHGSTTLDNTHHLLITDFMKEANDQGQNVTARMLQLYLRDKCNAELSLRRIRGYLQSWGCAWGRSVEVAAVDKEWHARRIAKFIVGYAEALRLEENGMHVIVYMDEL